MLTDLLMTLKQLSGYLNGTEVKAMFNETGSNQFRARSDTSRVAEKSHCLTSGPVFNFSNKKRYIKIIAESEKGRC
jgi:hypothetical protein